MFTVGPCMPGITVMVFRCWCMSVQEAGLIYMPTQKSNMKEGASAVLGTPGGPQVEPKVWVVQCTQYHYKYEHILISLVSPDRIKVVPFNYVIISLQEQHEHARY